MDQLNKKSQPELIVDSIDATLTVKNQVCPSCNLELPGSVEVCPQDGTQLSAQPAAGMLLAGKYEFISTIGKGGMGVIYKARQPILDKIVAIKMLHAHLMTPESLIRFQQEGKAISTLSHPGVVTVHDFGLTDKDQPYMVMDYVEGKILSTVLSEQGSLDLDRTMHLFLEICDVISHAHKNGILHRDLKPSNIMLIDEGTTKESVKILDFGIAKLMSDDGTGRVTRTGEALGSPLYMSPEQALGKPTDQSSDLYAIGCVMFECLTGSPPFVGSSIMDIMLKHINDAPPKLKESSLGKDFPAEIESVVRKLLSKNQKDRYQSADELSFDLLALQKGEAPKVIVLPQSYGVEDTSGRATTIKLIVLSVAIIVIGIVITSALVKHLFARPAPKVAGSSDITMNIDTFNMAGEAPVRGYMSRQLKKDPHKFVGQSWPITDEDLKFIFQQPYALHVHDLILSDSKVTTKGLQYISHLPLDNIELNHLPITDFSELGKIGALESISIEDTPADDQAMKAISRISGLKRLKIKGTGVTDAGFLLLSNCKKLQKVYITETSITANGVKALRKVLPAVEIYDETLSKECYQMRQKATHLAENGQFESAAELDKKICDYTSLHLPNTDLHYIKSHFLAAQHLRLAGKPRQSKAYAQKSVEAIDSLHGRHRTLVLSSLQELGVAQLMLGETDNARATFERAINVAGKFSTLDKDTQLHLADCHNKLGDIAAGQNRFTDATRELNEALHIYDRLIGPSNYESGMIYFHLGENLIRQRKFEGSLVEYGRALKIFEKLGMDDRRETAATIMHMGEALASSNKIDEAAIYFKRSQKIFQALKDQVAVGDIKRRLSELGQ